MQNRSITVNQFGKVYWKNGKITSGANSIRIDRLAIAWQTVNGDRKKPNAFRFWKVECTGLRGQCDRLDPTSGYAYEGPWISSSLPVVGQHHTQSFEDGLYAAVRQQALDRLTTKVRGDLDVSIDLLTLRQTKELTTRLFENTRHFVAESKKLRKRYDNGDVTATSTAGQLWLTYVFGIKPTVQTLYDALQKARSDVTNAEPLVRCRGRARRIDAQRKDLVVTGFSWQSASVSANVEVSVRCSFDLLLKANQNLLQKLGEWTSLNPASWAWELTKFSFLFDYFVNVGGTLRNLETALVYGSRFHSGTETKTVLATYGVGGASAKWSIPSDPGLSFTGLTGSHRYVLHDRMILGSYPLPRLPVVEADLGWRRVVNILALLSQLKAVRTNLTKQKLADKRRRVGRLAWWE